MKSRVSRYLGIVALLGMFGLGACSASQQQQADDELLDQQGQEELGQQEAQEQFQDQDSQLDEGEGEYAEQDSQGQEELEQGQYEYGEDGDQQLANEDLSEEQGEEIVEESTDNDLQEIISEINGDEAAPVADEGSYAEQAPQINQVGEGSAGGALPEFGAKMGYVVEPGDTLAKIAQKIYGSVSKWREIAELTGLANPNRIYSGDLVYYQLTQETQAFAQNYESRTKQTVQVGPGDTLASISRQIFGTQSQWRNIWRLNDRINNPDRLEVGMTIYYYGSASFSMKNQGDSEEDQVIGQVDYTDQDGQKVVGLVEFPADFEEETFVDAQQVGFVI